MLVCKKIRLKLKKAEIFALNEMSRWARWPYNYILSERIDFHKIDERGTSKTCSQCGFQQKMPLSVRTYKCPNCGLVMDRDCNSAINILHRFIARSEPQETVSMLAIAA